jgi:hypothetical protein
LLHLHVCRSWAARHRKRAFRPSVEGTPDAAHPIPVEIGGWWKFSVTIVAAPSDNFTTGIFICFPGMAREIWPPQHRAPHVGRGIACIATSRFSQGHRPPHCSLIVKQASARWPTQPICSGRPAGRSHLVPVLLE